MRSTAFSLLALLASAFAGNTPGSDDSNRHILFASEPDHDELYRDEITNPHNASDISEKPCIDEADSEYLRSFIDANADRITTALNPTCTDIAEYAEGELCDDKHVRQLCCEACHKFDDLKAGGDSSTDIVLQSNIDEDDSTNYIALWDLCCGVFYDGTSKGGNMFDSRYQICTPPHAHRRRYSNIGSQIRNIYDCCGDDSCALDKFATVGGCSDCKMKRGDGDCDYDNECQSNSCGSNNCPVGPGSRRRGTNWDDSDDCCEFDNRRRRRFWGRRAQEIVQPV